MKYKIKSLFAKGWFFYGSLIFFILAIGQLPIFLHILHTPQGYYYPYLDKISFSDYYYLGLIRYGMGPDWLLRIPYVASAHTASFIQIFFVWLGKLSLMTGIGPAEVFALFRILGGLVFLLSSLFFFKLILSPRLARLAFLLFLFAQPLFLRENPSFFEEFKVWVWHFGEAARRVSVMPPHYTLGKGLAVLSVCFLILSLRSKKKRFILFASVCVFFAGIIYPPPVFIIGLSLVLTSFAYIIIWVLSRSTPAKLVYKLLFVICYLFFALLPLLLLKGELGKGYPWNRWNQVELGWNSSQMHFELDYIRSLGFLVFIVPFSLISLVRRKQYTLWNYFIFFWFASSFLLFPFADMLHLGKFRFTEGAQLVPLTVLAVFGFEEISRMLSKVKDLQVHLIKKTFLAFFVLYFLLFTFLSAYFSTVNLWGYWTNAYFRPDELSALSYIGKYIPPHSVILSDVYPSNFIPAFARVRTIVGFSDFYSQYTDFLVEEKKILSILNGTLLETEAKEYLEEKKVDYVYYEKDIRGEKALYPDVLHPVYTSPRFTIYRVIQ